MDFTLSDEQRRWRGLARRFADEVVRPVAKDLDAKSDPAEGFSWEVVEAADDFGLRRAPLPSEHGGAGTDFLCNAVMLEEIAAADLGVSVVLAQTWKFMQLLVERGTSDQQERWVRRIAENPRGLMAASLTEPRGGSDNLLPYPGPEGGMTTRADRRDGGWVINGMKHYISNSNRADIILAFARTDPDAPVADGVTCFVVGADTPGVRFGKIHDKLGERLANNSEIFYEDVFVPDADVLGEENTALRDIAQLLRGSNAYAAACTLGVGREAFDRAFAYCKERVQGGRPIVEHESVQTYLADMYVAVDLVRTYVRRAAWASDHADPFDPKLASIPKLVASEASFDTVRKALELFGGAGVMKETGVEKLLRDASIFLHSDGTNIIMRKKVAADLLARDDPRELWDT